MKAWPLLLGIFLLAAVPSHARETLWRVESLDIEGEPAPPYVREETPFPLYEPPPEPVVVVDPKLTEAQRLAQERASRAAFLLERIRTIIEERRIFMPDVSNVEVKGRLQGDQGTRILIHNQWRQEGDKIYVPAMGAQQAQSILTELKDLDPDLAKVVEGDINDRLAEAQSMELTVTKIEGESVELLDTQGESYSIFHQPSGW